MMYLLRSAFFVPLNSHSSYPLIRNLQACGAWTEVSAFGKFLRCCTYDSRRAKPSGTLGVKTAAALRRALLHHTLVDREIPHRACHPHGLPHTHSAEGAKERWACGGGVAAGRAVCGRAAGKGNGPHSSRDTGHIRRSGRYGQHSRGSVFTSPITIGIMLMRRPVGCHAKRASNRNPPKLCCARCIRREGFWHRDPFGYATGSCTS